MVINITQVPGQNWQQEFDLITEALLREVRQRRSVQGKLCYHEHSWTLLQNSSMFINIGQPDIHCLFKPCWLHEKVIFVSNLLYVIFKMNWYKAAFLLFIFSGLPLTVVTITTKRALYANVKSTIDIFKIYSYPQNFWRNMYNVAVVVHCLAFFKSMYR